MKNWLTVIHNDIDKIDDFIDEYEFELLDAKNDIRIEGFIESQARQMPTITDNRFSQLQDVEAIYDHMDTLLKRERSKYYKQYLETYKRALTSRDVEKYIDGESTVVDLMLKINRVRLLRNKFASITKALEIKHYQLTNIVKMKVAGLDDADLGFDN